MIESLSEILEKIDTSTLNTDYEVCESPIEERLINHLSKFLRSDVELIPQFQISTISGNFRLDFLLRSNDKLIGLECDGKEFHTKELDDWYDEWRDTLILHQSDLTDIYRFRGKDILNSIPDLIYILSKKERTFFNSNIERLRDLVSEVNINCLNDEDYNSNFSYTKWNSIFRMNDSLQIKHMSKQNDLNDVVRKKCFLYSLLNPNVKIPDLIEIFKKDNTSTDELIAQVKLKYK